MKYYLFSTAIACMFLHFTPSLADGPSAYDNHLREEWNNTWQEYKKEKEKALGWFDSEDEKRKKLDDLRHQCEIVEKSLLVRAISTCQLCSEDTYNKCEEQWEFLEKNSLFWRCEKMKNIPIGGCLRLDGFCRGRKYYVSSNSIAAMYLDLSPNCSAYKTIIYALKNAVKKTENDEDKHYHEMVKQWLEVAQQAEKEMQDKK